MVFYETTFLLHGKYPAEATRLLIREVTRASPAREGCVFRILDLGWRHTAQPVVKKRVGRFFYGRWYAMTWAGPPLVRVEMDETMKHNSGVLRHLTEKLRTPKDAYRPRSTFYPTLVPGEKPIAGPLVHHTLM
ncbi:unnamed protein product [Prorocentrum cordatum]|uniref:Ribosomal protein S6 n=1 Tax=Prorocentrum cordatum TaxID=2364126 RepID=A0ABN9S0B0_9DINO|nr:unnamed protein product [Polarella glacialis]